MWAVLSMSTEPMTNSPAVKFAAAMPPTSWSLGAEPSLFTMRPVKVAPRRSVITLPGRKFDGVSDAVNTWYPTVDTETVALKTE